MPPSVRLLGTPALRHQGEWIEPPVGLPSALLFHLAYQRTWMSREALAFLFWPDRPEATARRNLRNLVVRVRVLPYADGLEIERGRLRWRVDTDVAELDEAIASNRLESLRLYGGELLDGFHLDSALEFSGWLELERASLRARRAEAVLRHVEDLERRAHHRQAAEALEVLHGAEPLDEVLFCRLLENLHAARQSRQALLRFDTFAGTLRRELGAEPEPATLDLIEAIRRDLDAVPTTVEPPPGPSQVAARTEPAAASHNLPRQITPFVGRDLERKRLADQLDDPACRLLTLLAPGGFGKTRLAVAAAETQVERFRDGVWFVDLTDLDSGEQLLDAVADALEPSLLATGNVWQRLLGHLEDRALLLILDNFEQLTSRAELISDMLKAAPDLKVLTTSRERLNLSAEWVLDLKGLSYPAVHEAEAAETFDAVRLFMQAGRRVAAGFALDEKTRPHVVEVCRLVEGMPLAIELAAGWLRALPVTEIVREIARGIDLLATSTRDVPERHQSIRVVFDTSWRLLDAQEQKAMMELAIFQAGFPREAALAVAGASLSVLGRLVDKAFLVRSASGRYLRHALVYQFTQQKLKESDAYGSVRERHGRHYARWLQQWGGALYQGKQAEVLALVEADLANVRAAWRWALENGEYASLHHTSEVIEKYHTQSNRFRDGLEFFASAERCVSAEHPELLVDILLSLTTFHNRLGHYAEVARLAARAFALSEDLGDGNKMARSYNARGTAALHLGNYPDAKVFFAHALDTARAEDEVRNMAVASNNLALTHLELGEYEQAASLYGDALAFNEALGNHFYKIKNLSNLGNLFLSMKRFGEAEAHFRRGLDLAEELGFQEPLHHILSGLAMVSLEQGEPERAEGFAREALRRSRASGEKNIEVEALRSLANVALRHDEERRANELFLRAIDLAWTVSALPYLQDVLADLAGLRIRQGEVDLASRILTLVHGHEATSQATREQAKALLTSLAGNEELSGREVPEMQALVEEILGRTARRQDSGAS